MPGRTRGEQPLHVSALCKYARVRGIAEEHVVSIYEREIERLRASAKVDAFVTIIAEKRTKDALRTYATGAGAADLARDAT